jgi:hypothetical protein
MVVQLIYISHFVGPTIAEDEKFIEGARTRNAASNITSIMLITEYCYIHCIEGERDVVSGLFIKIAQDPRHKDATILRFNEVSKREFSDFSAEISELRDFNIADNCNTICPDLLDIPTITSAKAMSLLRRVAAHHRANKI